MCRVLTDNLCLTDIAYDTSSCDRKPRMKGRQCGFCTSCILRRQAFVASGIYDDSVYVVNRIPTRLNAKGDYLSGMKYQVKRLSEMLASSDQWSALINAFPITLARAESALVKSLDITEKHVRGNILQMFQSYVDEWDTPDFSLDPDYMSGSL